MPDQELKPNRIYRTDNEIIDQTVSKVLDDLKSPVPIGAMGKIAHRAALVTLDKLLRHPTLFDELIELRAMDIPF